MLVEAAAIKWMVGGVVATAPLALMESTVDVKIDAPFLVAGGAIIGGAVKWVHGLWRTRRIYREHMRRNTEEHKQTLSTLSDKMDTGFTIIASRLDRQDEVIGEIREQAGKVQSTTETLFGMMVEMEGRNDARFEALDR